MKDQGSKVSETVKPAERRLRFIEARLAWVGDIGRADITDQFAISMQQATSDLGEYAKLAPDNLRYSPRKRRYLKDRDFKPIFRTTNVRNLLQRMVRLARRPTSRARGWVGDLDFKMVTPHPREPSKDILLPILKAIRERNIVAVDYVSMTSGKTEDRRVVPHAIGYDGFRWHVRVWDYKRDDYIDLVLTRIVAVGEQISLRDDLPNDWRWHDTMTFKVQPDQDFDAEKRSAIAREFGMASSGSPDAKGSALEIETTHAMLFYKLRLYGFDPRELREGKVNCRSMFGLELCNEEKVRAALN